MQRWCLHEIANTAALLRHYERFTNRRADQDCAVEPGSCAFNPRWSVPPGEFTGGPHNIRIAVTDMLGNTNESRPAGVRQRSGGDDAGARPSADPKKQKTKVAARPAGAYTADMQRRFRWSLSGECFQRHGSGRPVARTN